MNYNLIPQALYLSLWIFGLLYAYIVTRDILSPPIMYYGVAGFFYMDIFVNEVDLSVGVTYCILMICLLLCTSILSIRKSNLIKANIELYQYKVKCTDSKFMIKRRLFFIISLMPILSQLYMISEQGGFLNYLFAAKFATKEFAGLGVIKIINTTIYPINLVYFTYLICQTLKTNTKERRYFIVHFIITILMALLTFSRGTLLTHLIFIMLIWHHSKRKISGIFVIATFIGALLIAGIYGVLREDVVIGDNGISVRETDKKIKTEWMEFGTFPLKVLYSAPSIEPQLGLTYITAITNFVPRAIWPEKPRPGGVVFTKDYVPNLYDEYSDYTTGIFPEAIINFGIILGLLFGSFQLMVMFIMINKVYLKKYRYSNTILHSDKDIRSVVIYCYCLYAFPVYLTGEFTSVSIGLMIKILIVVFLCKIVTTRNKSTK